MKMIIPYALIGTPMLMWALNGGNAQGADTAPGDDRDSVTVVDSLDTMRIQVRDIEPYAIRAQSNNRNVIYTFSDSTRYERRGGTRAWRNNNPGCLRGTEFARANGAIGVAGGFAVFPDEQTGMLAVANLLMSNAYKNKTLAAVIAKYSPPHENNTALYREKLRRQTGLSMQTRVRDLTPGQLENLVDAIRTIEGWTPGREIPLGHPGDTTLRLAVRQMVDARTQRSL